MDTDMGLLNTNEQRIATRSDNAFCTITNYINKVDLIEGNSSYTY
ncbi:hypothetical protein GCM10011339_26320 [Echinicola rosea]|uniref:Uncharacterized protein n=2 Tax=Echinicola rosea TaxID=1807691 RepID=A0ABQ1V3I5_9BACT|nr:hypothetical protein GCM10011339_26320 [Echinicola rosea]